MFAYSKSLKANESSLSISLDFFRWSAAMLVVITHVNNRMFVSFEQIAPMYRSMGVYIWTFIAGFGHQSVVIFFVVSGYLVGGPLLKKALCRERIDFQRYFIDRAARIYVVLIPAMVLTACLDLMSNNISVENIRQFTYDFSVSNIILTLVNTQGILTGDFGSNGPLGTLTNEWWYYITAPLIIAPLCRELSLPKRILLPIIGIAFTGWFTYISAWHGIGLLLWLLGAFGALVKRSVFAKPIYALSLFIGILLGVRIFVRLKYQLLWYIGPPIDVLQSLAFVNVLVCLHCSRERPRRIWKGFVDANQRLASWSYSLYATHVPTITLCISVTERYLGLGWKESLIASSYWLVVFLVLTVTLVVAWTFSIITERNTKAARGYIYKLLDINKDPAVSLAPALANEDPVLRELPYSRTIN